MYIGSVFTRRDDRDLRSRARQCSRPTSFRISAFDRGHSDFGCGEGAIFNPTDSTTRSLAKGQMYCFHLAGPRYQHELRALIRRTLYYHLFVNKHTGNGEYETQYPRAADQRSGSAPWKKINT